MFMCVFVFEVEERRRWRGEFGDEGRDSELPIFFFGFL